MILSASAAQFHEAAYYSAQYHEAAYYSNHNELTAATLLQTVSYNQMENIMAAGSTNPEFAVSRKAPVRAEPLPILNVPRLARCLHYPYALYRLTLTGLCAMTMAFVDLDRPLPVETFVSRPKKSFSGILR